MTQVSGANQLRLYSNINPNLKLNQHVVSLPKEKADSFELTNTKEQEPVTFKEGAKLVRKAF